MQLLTRHSSWDARLAAGLCLGRLAEYALHFSPDDLAAAASANCLDTDNGCDRNQSAPSNMLSLEHFSLEAVLREGKTLLASGGRVSVPSNVSTPEPNVSAIRERMILTVIAGQLDGPGV